MKSNSKRLCSTIIAMGLIICLLCGCANATGTSTTGKTGAEKQEETNNQSTE